ncbi:MAG: hypothetical protein A3H96_02310 [Acidobacteria bacterium RIFCSPLOWO2_02_FULL_67_36]|nr:MAG: hypothetical protein A3H96_02310 [Acidobacteria bacterium RIFCSPLOWO2_02_FULL_67_36]
MGEFADIWIEQCDATREICEAWGTKKALGYLIGEKLLNHIRASDSDPSWAATLPLFASEIKRIFTAEQLAAYFATTTRIGSTAHVATDEQYQTMRAAGALDDDVVRGAADAVLFERARVLLLSGATPDSPL